MIRLENTAPHGGETATLHENIENLEVFLWDHRQFSPVVTSFAEEEKKTAPRKTDCSGVYSWAVKLITYMKHNNGYTFSVKSLDSANTRDHDVSNHKCLLYQNSSSSIYQSHF